MFSDLGFSGFSDLGRWYRFLRIVFENDSFFKNQKLLVLKATVFKKQYLKKIIISFFKTVEMIHPYSLGTRSKT